MKLKDVALRKAVAGPKPYKLSDGHGLYVQVNPNGSKLFRFKYSFAGKEKLVSLGQYPLVSLAEAREEHMACRKMLQQDVDPSAARKLQKAHQVERHQNTFKAVATEWAAKQQVKWTEAHYERVWNRLDKHVFPDLGDRPISEVNAQDVLAALKKIETHGAIDTAHRAMQNCGAVFRYGVATSRCKDDPTASLRGALKPVVQKHFSTITSPREIGFLLRDIDGYKGHLPTVLAMKLAALTFVRPNELRKAEWTEFDFQAAEWRIPAPKMKMRIMHIVPLSTQSLEILHELQKLTGRGPYLFPSIRCRNRPMSENAVLSALRRMGYTKDQMTGHGFRGMASTLLNESGRFKPDCIERQLAHGERNKMRRAYNHAEYLPERRKMMQWWANELDRLRKQRVVVPGMFPKAA